jgi:hypothetical protein
VLYRDFPPDIKVPQVQLTTELTCDARSEAPLPIRRTRDWGRDRVPGNASDWPCVVKLSEMLCCADAAM